MSSTDTFHVHRYGFHKHFVTSGTLTLIEDGSKTELIYKDDEVEVHASDPAIPSVALDNLRNLIETAHKSLIGVNGCRIDVSHGGEGAMCYLLDKAKKQQKTFICSSQLQKLKNFVRYQNTKQLTTGGLKVSCQPMMRLTQDW